MVKKLTNHVGEFDGGSVEASDARWEATTTIASIPRATRAGVALGSMKKPRYETATRSMAGMK